MQIDFLFVGSGCSGPGKSETGRQMTHLWFLTLQFRVAGRLQFNEAHFTDSVEKSDTIIHQDEPAAAPARNVENEVGYLVVYGNGNRIGLKHLQNLLLAT